VSDSDGLAPPRVKVGIEVLGVADRMEPERLAVIEELPAFMRAEGVEADRYFREPDGMGLPPLEVIAVFVGGIGVKLVGDLLKDAARHRSKVQLHGRASASGGSLATANRPLHLNGPSG